jgi:single-strand DNA-binding protein
MGLNQATVQGKLGKDPELRYTPGGDAVCKFSLAVSKKYTDKGGQKRENVYWANIVAWRNLAEICAKYLVKGQECIVTGELTSSEWEKNGVKMKSTEIVAKEMHFSGSAPKPKAEEEDDIPF